MVIAEDGCRLWTSESGSGAPLILCHGGPGLWDMFDDLTDTLPASMRVIRWDQRGCGRSERRGPYSLARTIADLERVREHFGLDRAAVLGHSWGATLALQYALAHPDRVSRLVYVSGTGLGRAWYPHYQRNLADRLGLDAAALDSLPERERAITQWTADFADRDRAEELARRMADPWFPVNYECNADIGAELRRLVEADLVAACRALSVPTLIVHGARDIRPPFAIDSLRTALPEAETVILREVGHVPWLEAPQEFSALLTAFLPAT